MANKIETPTEALSINVPDLVIDGTIIKRKAHLFTMIYNQHSKQVVLNWTVKSYADNGGEYGGYLSFIPDYSKESIADNNVAVNPATGEILQKTEPMPDTEPVEYDYPMDWVGQYDFFYTMGKNTDIKVHDVITAYGQQIENWEK